MKPKLYLDRRSPPVRAVLMLIEALQINIEENPIDLFKGEHYCDNFVKKNPLHTVPTFVDGELTLTDSHAILIYLCEKYINGDNQFWPSNQIERIKVLNRLFYSGTLLFRRDSDLIAPFHHRPFGDLKFGNGIFTPQFDITDRINCGRWMQ